MVLLDQLVGVTDSITAFSVTTWYALQVLISPWCPMILLLYSSHAVVS